MMRNLLSFFLAFSAMVTYAQIGIGTAHPQGVFNIDGAKDNPATGTPTAAQLANDVIIDNTGKIGAGMIPNVDDKAKVQVDGNITIEGIGIQTSNPQGIFNLDGAKDNPATGTPTAAQLANDVIIDNTGKIGAGMIPNVDDKAKVQVDGNITIEGIGIQTSNPQGIFNLDGAKDNPATGTPTAAQLANDVIIDNTGKIGAGMIPNVDDKAKVQVDGNITIEGIGIQTSNPQGIFNLDGAKDNPATGTPTAAQLANDVIIDNTGKIGAGMIPNVDDKAKVQVDGNITIEGIGIQTSNPQGIFNLDGAKDNPATGTPTAAQLANDVIIDNTGKIGAGMIPSVDDKAKVQVDGNITIEGIGIQTSNPQGIFNLDGAKDNPATGTPTAAQLANDVIIDNTGKIGAGMIPSVDDKAKVQVDGNITIEGIGIQTSNPQGIFNLDGAKDNPATGTPTAAQLANDVIIDNTGKIGVGMLPNTTDNSKLQVEGTITIKGDGTPGYEPGSGKILGSDANGRGYWAKNITVTPPVIGKLNNGSSGSINTQGPITGAYIDLPEGRWIVITNILLITVNAPGAAASANNSIQALWTRLTFGDKLDGGSTKGWCPSTGITGAGGQINGNLYCTANTNIAGLPTADIETGPYVSGTMVYPVHFGMANGTTIISHTCSKYDPSINQNGACTGIDPVTSQPFKRYYLTVASSMAYNGFNTTWNNLAAKNWSENGIVAFPVALDAPIVVP